MKPVSSRSHPAPHLPAEPSEAAIAHEAYLRWVANGRPAGTELADWFTAKEWLLHHQAASPAGPAARRKAQTEPSAAARITAAGA